MFALAFYTIVLTALGGAALGLLYLKPLVPRPPLAAAVHGIAGTFGLVVLALSLNNAVASGNWAAYAAIPISLAWVAGLAVAFLPMRTPRGFRWLIGSHAALALAGVVVLTLCWLGAP